MSGATLSIDLPIRTDQAERDGYPADPESIYLTAGASAGVSSILNIALQKGDGCLIPIPQYPLYTATLAFVSAVPLPYYLQEIEGWSMSHKVLIESIKQAKKAGTPVKALVIINPGNPTGACLSEEAIREVVQLCYDERILLLADEVYQSNIFDHEGKPFISFKKVLRSMPKEVANSVELVSFHSISKGMSGECGRRGGYFECVNISDEVMEQIYKMASVNLCPPVSGQVSRTRFIVTNNTDPQIGVDLLVHPPKPGQPSYPLYEQETSLTLNNLRERSQYMFEKFNSLPGMTCQPADGAMYLFPQIDMPPKAVEAAKKQGKEPDVMYALELLGGFLHCLWVRERTLTKRCDGNLRCCWIWVRTRGWDVPLASDCSVPRCRGLCEQDREVPPRLYRQVHLGSLARDQGVSSDGGCERREVCFVHPGLGLGHILPRLFIIYDLTSSVQATPCMQRQYRFPRCSSATRKRKRKRAL